MTRVIGRMPTFDGTPSMADQWAAVQVTQTTAVTKSGATATTPNVLPGLTYTVNPTGPADIYVVMLEPDVVITTAGTINIVDLVVDNVAEAAPVIPTSGPANLRVSSSKTFVVTGLAAGPRTIYARTYNTANSTNATVNPAHSRMTILRLT